MLNTGSMLVRSLMTNKEPMIVTCRMQSVVTSVRGVVGMLTLNRPKALNAPNLEVIQSLSPILKDWEAGKDGVQVVVSKGERGKTFCAGGDIMLSTEVSGGDMQKQFFVEEYQPDHLAGRLTIPYVAIMNDVTMGGVVGISVNGKYRVTTEKTVFALPRMTGQLGMLYAGVAPYAVSGDMVEFCKELEAAGQHGWVDRLSQVSTE